MPERPGGVRNWDYRFCWLRDATFTLYALMLGGYTEEAADWREWLLPAVAGEPAAPQILYDVAGERLIPESETPNSRGLHRVSSKGSSARSGPRSPWKGAAARRHRRRADRRLRPAGYRPPRRRAEDAR